MPSPQDRRIQLILSPTATSNTMSIFQSDHKEEILLKYKHVSVVLPFKGTSCFWSQKGSIAPLILLRAKCGFLNPGSLIPLGPYSEAMGKISLSTSTKDSLRSFSGALWLRSPSCRMSLEFSELPTVQVGPPTQYILLLVFATMGIPGTTSSSQTHLTISCPLCRPQWLKDLGKNHAMTSAQGHAVPTVTCEKENNSWLTVQKAQEHFCPDGARAGTVQFRHVQTLGWGRTGMRRNFLSARFLKFNSVRKGTRLQHLPQWMHILSMRGPLSEVEMGNWEIKEKQKTRGIPDLRKSEWLPGNLLPDLFST